MHYVIGDVHGCYTQLASLVSRLPLTPGEDTVIFTGDYIDYGPEPVLTLRFIKELPEKAGVDVVTLRGDHEQVFLLAIMSQNTEELPFFYRGSPVNWWDIWREMGGQETSRKLAELSPEELEEYIHWIAGMPAVWSKQIEDVNVLVSHAGIHGKYMGLEQQSLYDLLWRRNWEKDFIKRAKEDPHSIPWDRIIYGHQPYLAQAGRRRGLLVPVDGGCCYGGRLVAYRIEDDQVFAEPGVDYRKWRRTHDE